LGVLLKIDEDGRFLPIVINQELDTTHTDSFFAPSIPLPVSSVSRCRTGRLRCGPRGAALAALCKGRDARDRHLQAEVRRRAIHLGRPLHR
jgi:hypothetical protein